MSNPFFALEHILCDHCENKIPEGEKVYSIDGYRYCKDCAEANENVCSCGNYKKDNFEICYECFKNKNWS